MSQFELIIVLILFGGFMAVVNMFSRKDIVTNVLSYVLLLADVVLIVILIIQAILKV